MLINMNENIFCNYNWENNYANSVTEIFVLTIWIFMRQWLFDDGDDDDNDHDSDDGDEDEMWESLLFLSGVQWIPSPAISSAHYQQPQLPTRWDKHIIFIV